MAYEKGSVMVRLSLHVGDNPDFDKAVLVQILEVLSISPRPLLGSDIIVGLNNSDALTAQLPSEIGLFPAMQANSYVAGILKFAISQEWVMHRSIRNVLRSSRLWAASNGYSITAKGKNALQDKENIPAPQKIVDLPDM